MVICTLLILLFSVGVLSQSSSASSAESLNLGPTGNSPEDANIRRLRTRANRLPVPRTSHGNGGSDGEDGDDEGDDDRNGNGENPLNIGSRQRRRRLPITSLNDRIRAIQNDVTGKPLIPVEVIDRNDAQSWWPFVQSEFINKLYDLKFHSCKACKKQWPSLKLDKNGFCNRCASTNCKGKLWQFLPY